MDEPQQQMKRWETKNIEKQNNDPKRNPVTVYNEAVIKRFSNFEYEIRWHINLDLENG